jgi:hypothetical protein
MDLTDATQVITAADDDPAARFRRIPDRNADVTAFLPPATDPPPAPAAHAWNPATEEVPHPVPWEVRYVEALEEAWTGSTDASQSIAACRLAGEIREGLAAGLLPRWPVR